MNGAAATYGLDDHIYQRLLRERIVFLGSEVRDQNANAICAQLLLLSAEDPEADIYLHINSPGGSVDAGMAVENVLLASVSAGLGACFFGLFRHEAAVLEALGVPAGRRGVGTLALGHPAPGPESRSAGRPRRPNLHWTAWSR